MKKLFFLLSLLLLTVSTVKSQVYKFHVSHLEFFNYPSSMSFSESQEKHMLVQDGAFTADFVAIADLNKKVLIIQETNKPEVVFPIVGVLNKPYMIASFVINDHFADGTPVISYVTIGKVDNTDDFFYKVEHITGDKIFGGIDFEIKQIEVSK